MRRTPSPPHRASLLLAAMTLIVPAAVPAGTGPPGTVDRLLARGFENVAVLSTATDLVARYENRVLRYELHALGAAAAAALEEAGDRTLTLVPLNRGVPIVVVSAPAAMWRAFFDGTLSARDFGRDLAVRSDGSAPSIRGAPSTRNRSFGRTDVAVRPLFSFELGIADDPFRSAFYLAPEAVNAPGTGFLLTLQGAIRIYDDLDPYARRLAPGRSTASWGGWLPGGLLTAVSAGYFAGNRYGLALETSRLLAGGVVEVRAGGDWSGFLKFSEEVTLYSDPEAWSAFVAGTVRPPGIDALATVTAARFLEGALGARADVSRRFGEARVGFFAIGTEDDSVVGLEFEVPLPLRELPPPRALRFATVPAFPFEYRDTAQRIGLQVSLHDNTRRLRKGLDPVYLRNNLEDVRAGARAGRADR